MPKERGERQKLQLIPVYEVVGWSLFQREKAKSGCGCGPGGEHHALASKIWILLVQFSAIDTQLAQQHSYTASFSVCRRCWPVTKRRELEFSPLDSISAYFNARCRVDSELRSPTPSSRGCKDQLFVLGWPEAETMKADGFMHICLLLTKFTEAKL